MEELMRLERENNQLLKDNNRMLKELINVVNVWLSHHGQENDNDFARNILANLISSFITGR
jgi:nitrate reductase NapAB chaperone NapD